MGEREFKVPTEPSSPHLGIEQRHIPWVYYKCFHACLGRPVYTGPALDPTNIYFSSADMTQQDHLEANTSHMRTPTPAPAIGEVAQAVQAWINERRKRDRPSSMDQRHGVALEGNRIAGLVCRTNESDRSWGTVLPSGNACIPPATNNIHKHLHYHVQTAIPTKY